MNKDIERVKRGIFCGIGVGPGGGENMTLKAAKRIKSADVIVLPSKDKDKCRAYAIAKEAVCGINDKEVLCRSFPMTYDKDKIDKFHDEVFSEIEELLDEGKIVAFLTIGDPCIYSTYGYIRKRIEQKGFETETVSGVPSFCLAAAALGISLSEEDEQIHIIPGNADLKTTAELKGTRIFMKSGKKLAELREYLIEESEYRDTDIYTVSNCGLEDEKKGTGIASIKEEYGYLTLVIVKDRK